MGLSISSILQQKSLSGKDKEMNVISYKVGMGQILVEGGDVEGNLNRAIQMIDRAAEESCKMVVLPECLDIGWTYPEIPELAQPIPGKISEVLSHAAKEKNIYVIAGLTEQAENHIYNAALLISPEGEILIKHRKINILKIAQDIYSIGDRLSVAHTPLGTIGINICADNFPTSQVFAHSIARMGAQILLSPSAWAVPADHDNEKEPYGSLWKGSYTTLAELYNMTIIGVSNVGWIKGGPWDGRKCIGNSIAVDSNGTLSMECPYGVTAEAFKAVEVKIIPRKVKGTEIAEMLREKGYEEI